MAKKLSPVAQKALDHYLAQAPQSDNAWLAKVRETFAENAFPTTKDEDWQYTRMTGFLGHAFASKSGSVSAEQIAAFIPNFDTIKLVFVDGIFNAELSDAIDNLPKGLTLTTVAGIDATAANSSQNERLLAEPMATFNALNAQAGYSLSVAKNAAIETPIYVLNVVSDAGVLASVSNKIDVAENAEVTVIEQFVSLTDGEICATANNEISIAKHARFKQVIIQQLNTGSYYFNNQFIEQAESSSLNTFFASLGANISRHQNHLYMDGDHIESIQNSSCIASGKQTVDSRTYTEHNQLAGMSRQLHKFVLDQQAIGVFNGMIRVDQQAQKTDGQMDNKNLILSNTAKMNTKPQLEIYADDVQCSHGSASGQIDDNQIFYLQARGINREMAMQMITKAFVLEPLEDINNGEIRHWVENLVNGALAQLNSVAE